MKRFLTGLAVTALAFAPATFTVTAFFTTPAAASNTYDVQGFAGTGLGPGYVQTDWETNSNPVLVMQARVQCHPVAGGNEYYEYSGNVEGTEISDAATCLFAGIADHGWVHFKCDQTGCAFGDWESIWVRCCTNPVPFVSPAPTIPVTHTTALMKRGQCECVHWQAYQQGMKSEWTDNPNGFFENAWSYCDRSGVPAVYVFGTWRTSSFVYSYATCPSQYNIIKGGWQQKDSPNGTVTRHQTYP